MCIRLDRLAKQNALRVSHRKALPARYSQDITVSIWPDSSHSNTCRAHDILHGMLSREIPAKPSSIFKCLSFHTTLSITLPLTMKSHNTYKVQLIEYNYNQIWHGIKANKTYSCKEHLYSPKEIGIMIIL